MEAEVGGKKVVLSRKGESEVYEHTFSRLEKGTHLVRLFIRVGEHPLIQHELVVVQVEGSSNRK